MNERLDRFTKLLKEIFELDKSDLDFGIYRVMNLRKTQIEQFLTERLPQMVQETLTPFAQGSKVGDVHLVELAPVAAFAFPLAGDRDAVGAHRREGVAHHRCEA